MFRLNQSLKTIVAVAALSFGSLSFAADIDVNANTNDVAIKGYDTVAYFTQSQAVKGSAEYTATYKNAIYHFSSAENRDAFRENPRKYAPQFGGYCAFGVTKEKKFDTDPLAWRIVDDKLYLNLNKKVQKIWTKDVPGNIASAFQIWPDISHVASDQL